MSEPCLATLGMYISGGECAGRRIVLKDFWAWNPRGNKDACICWLHAQEFMQKVGRGFLADKLDSYMDARNKL